MAKRPTLRDVAAQAKVATTTVARVLRNEGYISDETRHRVEEAVRSTGYRVNSLARSLKSDRSFVIGHLLRSTVPNPYYVEVARGVEDHTEERGYTALTYNVHSLADAERRGIETFLGWQADGIIFTTPVEAGNVEFAVERGTRVIQVERPVTLAASRIVVRNGPSAIEALRHLAGLGHRHIAYLGPNPDDPPRLPLSGYVERERFSAYVEVMAAIGASTQGLIRFGENYQNDVASAQGHGFSATLDLLAHYPKLTAIYASNDILAAGAMQAIYQRGLHIPRDISVVGFDDTLAEYVSPLLTTVRLPARRIGMAAAKLLIDQIEGIETADIRELTLDAEFIRRDSTGPARS